LTNFSGDYCATIAAPIRFLAKAILSSDKDLLLKLGEGHSIVELTQEGKSQRQIAAALGVDEKTVRNDKNAENSAETFGSKTKNAENSASTASSIRKQEGHPESDEPPAKSNMVNRLSNEI